MVDYTKIKELIFKLLKENYPNSFTPYTAKYGEITISWSSADFANNERRPFITSDRKAGPVIRFYIERIQDVISIPLSTREFLELQLILEEVYPKWVQWRADDVEKALQNLVSPTNFDQAQDQILND